ncbi:MAG: TRAM domain-containing protein, partial [Dehalococcoidia bacterium]|nr:TRAM domain-containing protein [Dehalococcoidia bacterium]
SPRPGTFAYRKLDDDVPKDLKKSRLHLIEEIHSISAEKRKSAELGKTVEILVEKKTEDQLTGRTRKNQLVHFNSNASIGDLVDVQINEVTSWSMRGTAFGTFALPILTI